MIHYNDIYLGVQHLLIYDILYCVLIRSTVATIKVLNQQSPSIDLIKLHVLLILLTKKFIFH